MALKDWGAAEVVTNSTLNVWLAEKPDTVIYYQDILDIEWSENAGSPVVKAKLNADRLIGQYVMYELEMRRAPGGTQAVVLIEAVASGIVIDAHNFTDSSTTYVLKRIVLDLRKTPTGAFDEDARGRQIEFRISLYQTGGTTCFMRRLKIAGGNTSPATDYGDVD